MAKRTRAKATTSPKSGKAKRATATGRQSALRKPDTSVLADYDPTDTAGAHPAWVKEDFAAYIAPDADHAMTSVREFSHGGHHIKVFTTYRVEVDGAPVHMHLSVDEDGRVHTHATPFVTYGSALDLMKAVLDAYPDSFDGGGGHHGPEGDEHHHHDGHGESGR